MGDTKRTHLVEPWAVAVVAVVAVLWPDTQGSLSQPWSCTSADTNIQGTSTTHSENCVPSRAETWALRSAEQ